MCICLSQVELNFGIFNDGKFVLKKLGRAIQQNCHQHVRMTPHTQHVTVRKTVRRVLSKDSESYESYPKSPIQSPSSKLDENDWQWLGVIYFVYCTRLQSRSSLSPTFISTHYHPYWLARWLAGMPCLYIRNASASGADIRRVPASNDRRPSHSCTYTITAACRQIWVVLWATWYEAIVVREGAFKRTVLASESSHASTHTARVMRERCANETQKSDASGAMKTDSCRRITAIFDALAVLQSGIHIRCFWVNP